MTKKKAAPAKATKPTKTPKAEKSAKAAKAPAEELAPAARSEEEGGDIEEAEEEEPAASSSGGGNAAALAAAGSGEMSASFKNFRHHPDMENFYRFIFENDLRHEALAILNQMVQQKQIEKASKKPASSKR